MARRRRGRPVDGVLLLDKPAGVSSNYILQQMKRLYGAAKAGHTGALDPLATGMLPICLGEATKFSQYLLDADKHYQTTAKLGIKTASGDAEGEVLETRDVPPISASLINDLLKSHFNGEITQIPSMYSALKHEGQPLYKLARKGIKVEVKKRQVTIYHIELIDLRDDEFDLDICCSKGTYVRSIVEDLGELIGCGAHVSMLRRLDSGPYLAQDMLTPEQIQQVADQARDGRDEESAQELAHQALDKLLLPAWTAVEHLSQVQIDEDQLRYIGHGNPVTLTEVQLAALGVGITSDGNSGIESAANTGTDQQLVKIFAEAGALFLGLGEISADGRLCPRRLISTQ